MADSPKHTESAQALFCAIVDYTGKKFEVNDDGPIPPTFDEYYNANRQLIDLVYNKIANAQGGTSKEIVYSVLRKDNEWYRSSVSIANEIADIIDKYTNQKIKTYMKSPGLDLYFGRGDKEVMGNMSKIFSLVREQVIEKNNSKVFMDNKGRKEVIFSQEDKWNPADFYFATEHGRNYLRKLADGDTLTGQFKYNNISNVNEIVSFGKLNDIIKIMIKQGDLVPISLKKSRFGKTIIKSLNYGTQAEAKKQRDYDIKLYKTSFGDKGFFNTIDCRYYFTNANHNLQIRDASSSGGTLSPKFQLRGTITGSKTAFDGGISASIISLVCETIGESKLADIFSKTNLKQYQTDAGKCADVMIGGQDQWSKQDFDDDNLLTASKMSIFKEYFKFAKKYASGTPLSSAKAHLKGLIESKPMQKTYKNGFPTLRTRTRLIQFLFGKHLLMQFAEVLKTKKEVEQKNILTKIVNYAGSRSSDSSAHIKAADTSSF